MGIRIDEITIGGNCFCHPATPNVPDRMYILFNGITGCPGKPEPPNGDTFVCVQSVADPCLFVSEPNAAGAVAAVQFFCLLGSVSVSLFIPGGDSLFFDLVNLPVTEYEPFANDQVGCGAGNSAIGGSATVFWLDTVLDLVEDLSLPTDGDGLFLESFWVSATQIVHRFANTSYELNQMVKINT